MSTTKGGELIAPQVIAIEAGQQEMLKQSHIKVDSNYFALDANLNFDASTILCEDRVFNSDTRPVATEPISFTIQPQFNVFRSLSESRFVFLISVTPVNTIGIIPKPYWSALFINNFVININNVSCGDQHSYTAQYAHFIKTILIEGNLKTAYVGNPVGGGNPTSVSPIYTINSNMYGCAGEDLRTLTEGIINTDFWSGLDEPTSYSNLVLSTIAGFGGNLEGTTIADSPAFPQNLYAYNGGSIAAPIIGKINVELTYRPRDGIWQNPKLLPPGVNLNYIMNLNTLGTFCSGYIQTNNPSGAQTGGIPRFGVNPDTLNSGAITYNIIRAQYYERQYTCTQTALKAYQSLIMRQPLYFSCLTSNTLLFPVDSAQTSVQLTNVFAGRLPNIIVVGLLNQSPNFPAAGGYGLGNVYQNLTYSPLPGRDRSYDVNSPPVLQSADCINSALLTINGRTYPHMWTSNMQSLSNQDLSQWYEQYRQCSLICKDSGRPEEGNLNLSYKMDNPLLSFGEFKANFTFLCFNIRRNGTIISKSGDKEVGSAELLVTINGTNHPGAQLMLVAINTDSLLCITDGGSSSSFTF